MTGARVCPRARIIIIFVISWHSTRRAHQSENRINSTVTFTPKFKIRRGEGRPRGPAASPVKYHLIPREIRFNFARHNIPGSLPNVEFPAARIRRIEIFSASSFARKMFRSSGKMFFVTRAKSNFTEVVEKRNRYRRKNAFCGMPSVISLSCRIYSFLFLPPAFSLLIVL